VARQKEAALKIGYNNVSSIRDYQRGQDHCAEHTAVRFKAQKWSKKKKILLVVIVEKIG